MVVRDGHLPELGVSLTMTTGANRLVAAHVANRVGMSATSVHVFAEIEPNQKKRVACSRLMLTSPSTAGAGAGPRQWLWSSQSMRCILDDSYR